MRSYIKIILIWFGLSILMMIFWIGGLALGNVIFPNSLTGQASDSGNNSGLILFLTCLLNSGVVLYFIYHARCAGIRLAGIVFLVTFGVQYFLSQTETLWFNDALKIPVNGIWAIVSAGAIQTLLFSVTATWITGHFKYSEKIGGQRIKTGFLSIIRKILLLSAIVWPVIYLLAGYFIAWQYKEVRLFYSGTTVISPFLSIMEGNVTSGLYFFQIFRGLLWILIALPVLAVTKGSMIHKGIILGLLFAVLGSSQLLLPNPYMPGPVRMAHLIETSSSNFIWGFIIASTLTIPLQKSREY